MDGQLERTALYDLHKELGGKMVPYAGYALPLQYSADSVIESHLHTRSKASLFDVSHMGQLRIWGEHRVEFAEYMLPSNVRGAKEDQGFLSVLLNEQGGILDDLIVTKKEDHLNVVVNAACKHNDLKHMRMMLEKFREDHPEIPSEDLQIEYLQDSRQLLALQGPKAAEVLQTLLPPGEGYDLNMVPFMRSFTAPVAGVEDCWVTRCGYTGEDGFEISMPKENAVELAEKLLAHEDVKPAGLGARDTLRMEAGLCLYGNDINDSITPVEAGLTWTIAKRRREEGGFPGHEVIMKQIKQGVERVRVGLLITKGAPARQDSEIVLRPEKPEEEPQQIGVVTSGIFSPILKKAICMGYVSPEYSHPGTELGVLVRNRLGQAQVTKMPFVPTNYFVPPKKK